MAPVSFRMIHDFVMTRGAFDKSLIFVWPKLRKFSQKCYDVPKKLITVRDAPGWHARHLESVLHDPKFLRRGKISSAAKFGCPRIEAARDFCSRCTGTTSSPVGGQGLVGAAGVGSLVVVSVVSVVSVPVGSVDSLGVSVSIVLEMSESGPAPDTTPAVTSPATRLAAQTNNSLATQRRP